MCPGAKTLGLTIRPDSLAYDLLFDKRQAPDGTPLGRAPAGGRKAAEAYKALLAAEPHATAECEHPLCFCVMLDIWTKPRQTGRKPSSGQACTAA